MVSYEFSDSEDDVQVAWAQFRRRDVGGAVVEARASGSGGDDPTDYTTTVFYPAGVDQIGTTKIANHGMANMLGGTLENSLCAVPQVLPPGNLIRLAISKGDGGSVGASPLVRIGVYTNKGGAGNNNLYPDQLLYDSGDLIFSVTGLKGGAAISVALAGGLYWFVVTSNADAATANTDAVEARRVYPILGMTLKCAALEPRYNNSAGVGHRHAQVFGALPATFPSSAPRRMAASNNGEPDSTTMVPVIYYGFAPP